MSLKYEIVQGSRCSQCLEYYRSPNTGKIHKHGKPMLCFSCWEKGDFYDRAEVLTFKEWNNEK